MSSQPAVHLVITADQVFPQINGKWCVIGIFSRMAAAAYPVNHPGLGIYMLVSGVPGRVPFRFELRDAEKRAVGAIEGEITAESIAATTEVGFNLRGVILPAPGEYHFHITLDGTEIRCPGRLEAMLMDPSDRPGNAPAPREGAPR